MAISGLRPQFHIWAHRAYNRYADLRARAAGYCNHNPWHPIPGLGGGYAHWRCARRAGHIGLHRLNNYVWDASGRTTYQPLPQARRQPAQPWRRRMTPTAAQQRARDRWDDQQAHERLIRSITTTAS